MITEKNYNANSKMNKPFPKIKKLGVVSPNGETSPFVFKGRSYRLELHDPNRGANFDFRKFYSVIRDRLTGEIISEVAHGCYYNSFYQEGDKVYVIGTRSNEGELCGSGYYIFESEDLMHWEKRLLIENPGWKYFNSSLTKGPHGYVLCMEAAEPAEFVGNAFTCFFATSPDMVNWTFMDFDNGYPTDRYCGGPYLRYSNGWYYLILVTALPNYRYTNYIYRTKDFETWYVGDYNPILMPSDEDRIISPLAKDLTDTMLEEIRTGYISNNSDIDMCDLDGKTLLVYSMGNQLGFYYLCEAEFDGTVDEFLASYFE